MPHTSALPFVLRRDHSVVSGFDVTSTVDQLHGLLHLDGERLRIQWRATREVSRVGSEIRTDRALAPLREVTVPIAGLAGARVRRAWKTWRFVDVLVLTASDMRAFDGLTGDDEIPGLVLEHPAEIVLQVRRVDRMRAREFASELRLAVSERLLADLEEESKRFDESHLRTAETPPPLDLDHEHEPAQEEQSRSSSRQKA